MMRVDPAATLGITATSIFGAIVPFIRSGSLALMIDGLTGTGTYGPVARHYFGWIVGVVLLLPIVWAQSGRLLNLLSRRVYTQLQKYFEFEVVKKHSELDIAAQEDPTRKDLFQRAYEDGTSSPAGLANDLPDIAISMLGVILGLIVLWKTSWWVLPVLILATVPQLRAELMYGKVRWGVWAASTETRRRLWSLRGYFGWVDSLAELKIMQADKHLLERVRETLENIWDQVSGMEKRSYRARSLTRLLTNTAGAGVALYFIAQAFNGKLSVGALTFFLTTISSAQSDLSSFFNQLGGLHDRNSRVTDVFSLLDLKPIITYPQHGIKLGETTPEIRFENVGFAYPGASEAALKNISFILRPGEKLALVGINGAGKTTLVKLLCRLYDPTSGRIIVDGQDIKEIDIVSWYKLIGILPQAYNRYEFSVKEAIAMGRTSDPIDEARVIAAAKQADADSFISTYKKGYDEQLSRGFGGVEPSVGQWQKLALARVFYRNPNVWILDEPTASIDAEAETKVFDQIAALPKDRSAILISHRFSTVRHADQIMVIEKGNIIEQGSHMELTKKDGVYAKLFKLQAKGYQ